MQRLWEARTCKELALDIKTNKQSNTSAYGIIWGFSKSSTIDTLPW